MDKSKSTITIEVLSIQVDVTALSHEQRDQLRLAMEAQSEVDYPNKTYVLNSGVKTISLPNHEEDCECDLHEDEAH